MAVAYADWQAARSAPPEEILAAAAETGAGADAFLIDTWGKGAGGLFDALSSRSHASRGPGSPDRNDLRLGRQFATEGF